MTDLFAPAPTDNLLPYDGKVNDLGVIIDDATALYNTLLNELPWQPDIVTLFGKTHITTRQIVWMGDTDADYQYSGHVRQTVPWSDVVFHVKQKIEQALAEVGVTANSNTCLLNYYPSGADGMGYHADDEKELGQQPVIASLSLGATRKFVFKHKKTQDKVELYLESGQLVVMHGDTQIFWKHTITKTKTIDAGRISLTFRNMLTS
ncbi:MULTISPECIES: alpha-ketoglutarate-dependent dioxygenase AlkB [unclassified Psychrobacter]|uniref:alpha-ketoglutarate-dependent dioxygenase AlkB family protein n=1 Tax=unclassified Psychrobacter TaxID=196806 RepID=UPI000C33B711|nr:MULTISPECIES: alpha-ketoglutarate-dependent dioxygenase AlkB [unclassified Psychrobacter]MBA6244957.1 alpha-ketoglutarate-dependent dioxygenase AlkB [Psychrobacter sp. Urea-trap-18]MBA6286502.1 alpha-ketoglutarate-dependent dioxygenase AlkB [Psychrobacter sp. Urea-trap-16]MBA6318513.1 alpha-ketoglutarate-dependent dioxygenase AlkB [Psychrobacter sp. Urea-trap-20]MBA6334734.1 alpha-ketoglutarate-dependent dioxygenase AlkB [Psychrobacter sp. Urea-trap-19]PKG61369.1 alpha-ketoglutarate-depende